MDRANYTGLPELEYLDAQDLEVIEVRSKALSLEECYDYLLIDVDALTPAEVALCKKAWRRGRMSSISTAADKLFNSMDTRNGGAIALEYLRALSSTFHLEPTDPGSGSVSAGGFSFNVVMPEDKSNSASSGSNKPSGIKAVK
jgi:hypothetical protein